MSDLPSPFAEMWLTHPMNGQPITMLCPCIEIEFYLLDTNRAALQDFYDQAIAEIGPELTHYQAETMKRPKAIDERAKGMVATWLRRPKGAHYYNLTMYGGDELGLNPLSFSLSYWDTTPNPNRVRAAAFVRMLLGSGAEASTIPTSAVRMTVPIDHRFADAGQLIPWLKRLMFLQEGPFLTGHCGYALNTERFLGVTNKAREWLALRYPGLAFTAGGRLSSYSAAVRPDVPSLIPLIRRAAWITIVHRDAFELLGGEPALRAAFADTPAVDVHSVPQGVIVQAGPHPELGDLERGDSLPVLRKVAKVLRPIRAERTNSIPDAFWDAWFELLDREAPI